MLAADARRRRRRQRDVRRRRDRAHDGRARRRRRERARVARARRLTRRDRELARPDRADVGRDRESRRRRATADRRRRRSRPRLDEARLGQDQLLRRQRAEDARLGRPHGAAVRGAPGLAGSRREAARRGRRRERCVEPMYQLTPLQLAIVNGHYTLGEAAHRARRRRRRRLAVHRRRHAQSRLLRAAAESAREGRRRDLARRARRRCSSAARIPTCRTRKGFRGDGKPRLPERTVAGEIPVPPGATPLDRAAAASDFAAVETLLAHGASATVVDGRRHDAADAARGLLARARRAR